MGKRKERRAAASGRRVKLDLFAEPSGDLGGPSAGGEVERDGNSKTRAGSPNSPSSSGQLPENPLSLLGQYSDYDLDDESSELVNNTVVDTPLTDFNNQQANVAADKENEQNTGINSSTNHDSPVIGQHNIQNGIASTEILHELQESSTAQDDASDSVTLPTNKEHEEQDMSLNVAHDMQVNGDMSSGWKMVLHEESNQYYYWNTLTGETSWNIPDVFAEMTSEVKNNNDAKGTENAVVGMHESNSSLGVNPEVPADTQPAVGMVNDGNCKIEEMPNLSKHLKVSYEDPSAMPKDSCALHQESCSPEKLESKCSAAGACAGNMQNLVVPGEHESGTDLCSHILRRGEFLLERLNTLKGSKGRLIGHDKISKYTVEVETRVSDINSLSMHASSLLPFWLHCEKKFKQLESAISDEVLQFYESVEANENNLVPSEEANTSHDTSVAEEVLKERHSETENSVAVKNNLFTSIVHVNSPSDSNPEGICEVHEAAVPGELAPMAMVHSEEDVDMDVEMELEDVIPASASTYSPLEQQPIWPNAPAEHVDAGIPPPPDDDWIPPPPPDDETFPPPPPDDEPVPPPPLEEVPETSYPVPLPDPMMEPSFSYAAQYNVPYPGPSIEYYGQPNAEVQESNYYGTDPNQLSVPLQSYYETVPNAYPAPAPPVVNLGEHGSYYGLQDETAPPVPGVTGVQSSVLYFAASEGSLNSDQIKSNNITVSTDGTVFSTVNTESGKNPVQDSASVSDQAAATISATTISATQVSSMSSIPTVAAAAPKAQPKVPRNKKRAASTVVSTLKSNKKVSSLVDKWKAAKEELHEEEDEPENAYEMLEKKRQREIEEWRAQQIASGEAKDNANFQPLGGDWRERVKRKRARLMKKSVEDLSESVTNGNQQPDLDRLRKDLPSGWQVYWDDASKQVYYGNSVTSETTWIRPT
ncbi:uncharacterized protein LOC108218963 isoform X1 [Daucus carota subsp. sativus]|uniref:uncharacterized protein LOC108218963 isoform X1 n=1 Tax=Daucus carota subsp. sativus TaxID=79200 RepID=UPI0007EF683E|nr:PREDICTED: uncharacterized protein LOC108218963 isoform X1 [Daucus carota subsp. sativus]